MQVGFYAPHGPGYYQDQHASMFAEEEVPRSPATNEEDVSDKPASVSSLPKLTDAQLDENDVLYRRKLRSLQLVDEFLGAALDDPERLRRGILPDGGRRADGAARSHPVARRTRRPRRRSVLRRRIPGFHPTACRCRERETSERRPRRR